MHTQSQISSTKESQVECRTGKSKVATALNLKTERIGLKEENLSKKKGQKCKRSNPWRKNEFNRRKEPRICEANMSQNGRKIDTGTHEN